MENKPLPIPKKKRGPRKGFKRKTGDLLSLAKRLAALQKEMVKVKALMQSQL
jgi:hypothetical protein